MKGGRAALLLVVLVAGEAMASAEERRTFRLTYRRGAGAASCPDQALLMSSVSVHLGYVPWDPRAVPEIRVEVARRASGIAARVRLRDNGGVVGSRELSSPQARCDELAAAVALAIAIAIDPLNARLAPSSSPASAPATIPRRPIRRQASDEEQDHAALVPRARAPAPTSIVPPVQARPRRRYSLTATIGGLVAVGAAPAVAGGLEVRASLRWSWVSLGLEGRIDLPAEGEVRGFAVRSSLLLGSFGGCAHWSVIEGCGLISAGALLASGDAGTRSHAVTVPYAAAVVRLGVDFPLGSFLSLRAHADLLTPLTRVILLDDLTEEMLWNAPAISGAFGLGLAGKIL